MNFVSSSHDPYTVYTQALNKAMNGTTVYVYERGYDHGDIWYEAYTSREKEKEWKEDKRQEFLLEMVVSALEHELTPMAKTIIHKVFRRIDDSNLWPISGRFNATERAIGRMARSKACDCAVSYVTSLSAEISKIVNKEVG